MLHAVIMAGGAGTRFWPASRIDLPKQLLNLVGDRSMLQATTDRLGDLVPPDRQMVVTNGALVAAIAEQLPDLPAESVVGEPCKRDTAPCIGLAAALVAARDPDATMVVMPADHVIQRDDLFRNAIREAVRLVDLHPGRIVTFGIRPDYPAESFGYVERGKQLADTSTGELDVYAVQNFHEKPTAKVAQQYLDAGTFFWNSGIFVWKARTILDALAKFEPNMVQHLDAIAAAIGTAAFATTLEREFTAIEGKSIDYAVMERYPDVTMIEAPFDWDDLGSWRSLARLRGTDDQNNTVVGRNLAVDTHGCIMRSDGDHLIVTVGMQDCIIVHTNDATIVARKEDEESIRKVVDLLKDRGWDQYL